MCNKEKFWPALCDALNRPEWKNDDKYSNFQSRLTHRDQLTDLIDHALSDRPTEDWLKIFAGTVPIAPVNDLMQALENPFVTNHDRLQTLEHPSRGDYRLVANPVHSSAGETPSRAAPTLGQHTDEILRELNYNDANISELRTSKVI